MHVTGSEPRAVVLVEGTSDQSALEALAERRGRDLAAEGIAVVPIGGAQAIGRFLQTIRPSGARPQAGGSLRRRRGGRVPARSRAGRPRLRAHSRGHGAAGFLRVRRRSRGRADPRARRGVRASEVVDAQGDLGSFRTLQKQPAWQGRATEEQLRRFMGSGGRRKIRYARLLVEALDLTRCRGHSTWCLLTSEPRELAQAHPSSSRTDARSPKAICVTRFAGPRSKRSSQCGARARRRK